jgi:predicted transglutaminase-like cysteine proteinase
MINLKALQEVNASVNVNTEYQMPEGDYHWENSDEQGFKGMCADQSIAKWERLLKLGVDKPDMRFAIVGVDEPGDHMILCVHCEDKWWALDIRYPDLMDPEQLPYSWSSWGSGFNAGEWTTVRWA